eukprot:jgi/Psemu1/2154/gm1.2154_g
MFQDASRAGETLTSLLIYHHEIIALAIVLYRNRCFAEAACSVDDHDLDESRTIVINRSWNVRLSTILALHRSLCLSAAVAPIALLPIEFILQSDMVGVFGL